MLLNETMDKIQQPKSTVITIKQSSNNANNSLSKELHTTQLVKKKGPHHQPHDLDTESGTV